MKLAFEIFDQVYRPPRGIGEYMTLCVDISGALTKVYIGLNVNDRLTLEMIQAHWWSFVCLRDAIKEELMAEYETGV